MGLIMSRCCDHASIPRALSRGRLPSNPNASHSVTLFSVHRLPVWRFRRLESDNWRALPPCFGARAFLVNFKLTRKRCSGANSRSWRHSRSPPPREIRASKRSAPTLRGGHASNQRYARPAPLRPRKGRLSITQESWRPSNRYLQRCEARCKRTCRPAAGPNSTQ